MHRTGRASAPSCGGELRRLGEDVSEVLEYVPARFKVIRHVRPKLACATLRDDRAGRRRRRGRSRAAWPVPGCSRTCWSSKYADHLPLYRQSADLRPRRHRSRPLDAGRLGRRRERLARSARSRRSAATCSPPTKLHADDTPVPVLCPGRGTTKTGRLWTYVRDDRPAGSDDPPAVLFRYSPDRKGERPRGTWPPSAACCRPMAMPASIGSTSEHGSVGSGLLGACAAQVLRPARRARPRRSREKRSRGSASSTRSKRRSADDRPSERRSSPPGARRSRCSTRCTPGCTQRSTQLSKKSELADAIRYALVALGGAHPLSR